MPGTILSTWHGLTHLIFTTTLGNNYHYYPHFRFEKMRNSEVIKYTYTKSNLTYIAI